MGQSEQLNTAQINLLRSTDYSSNIRITALCKRTNAAAETMGNDSLVYYLTVIPEKEAVFTSGQDALIEYLKENSKEKRVFLDRDKLKPGKVTFTVTRAATVANARLTSTSGYSSADEAMVKLISDLPGKWAPAANSEGAPVDQELVFFFGLEGC